MDVGIRGSPFSPVAWMRCLGQSVPVDQHEEQNSGEGGLTSHSTSVDDSFEDHCPLFSLLVP